MSKITACMCYNFKHFNFIHTLHRIGVQHDRVSALLRQVTDSATLQHSRRLTLVFDLEQVLGSQVLVRRIAPKVLAYKLMQPFSEGFSQAVSNGLHHDVIEVITLQIRYTGVHTPGSEHQHMLSTKCNGLLGPASSQIWPGAAKFIMIIIKGTPVEAWHSTLVSVEFVFLSASCSGACCHIPSMTKECKLTAVAELVGVSGDCSSCGPCAAESKQVVVMHVWCSLVL